MEHPFRDRPISEFGILAVGPLGKTVANHKLPFGNTRDSPLLLEFWTWDQWRELRGQTICFLATRCEGRVLSTKVGEAMWIQQNHVCRGQCEGGFTRASATRRVSVQIHGSLVKSMCVQRALDSRGYALFPVMRVWMVSSGHLNFHFRFSSHNANQSDQLWTSSHFFLFQKRIHMNRMNKWSEQTT